MIQSLRAADLGLGAALVAAGLLVVSATPAAATAYCSLEPTADGFVALRAAPSPRARLVARMRPGRWVKLDGGAPRAGWSPTIYWPASRMDRDLAPGAGGLRGWARSDLLGACG